MRHRNSFDNEISRRPALGACVVVLIAAFTMGPSQLVHAERVRPPSVPGDIVIPIGNKAFLIAHAVGTQNYSCLPSGNSVAWTLFGPQATLFDDDAKQVITHFLSANPA